ncbi:hypothetical protein [Cellulomonas sp. Y8]|uniref:hypothetical protein n=1 Tax=Cellulomonas sp. Y8 TaxID=2591145 RepID=UPI003D71314E
MNFRLSVIAPDLVARFSALPEAQLRSIATAVALWAVNELSLTGERVDAALDVLREGAFAGESTRSGVEQLVSELDDRAWAAQESGDDGRYLLLFRRARAADSLWSALGDDVMVAAADTVYEAQAAAGDLSAVRSVVEKVIS